MDRQEIIAVLDRAQAGRHHGSDTAETLAYRETLADALMHLAPQPVATRDQLAKVLEDQGQGWCHECGKPQQPDEPMPPTREQIAQAIHDAVWPNCPNEHVVYADGPEGNAADAVLNLLGGDE